MKLWIDDLRDPPDSSWRVAKTSEEALSILERHLEEIQVISFDHDLGGNDTSRPVVAWLEELAYCEGYLPIRTCIHSANPVGREWMEHGLKRSTVFSKSRLQ